MSIEIKKWKDGSEYIWHGDKNSGYARLTEEHMNKIQYHIKKYLGNIEYVIHENESKIIHMDVLPLTLPEKFSFNMLVTMGMSAKPMNVPEYINTPKYTELVMLFPKKWKLNDLKDKNYSWPIGIIKHLGCFPHYNSTFFGFGHSIPNGEPPADYADNTELCSMLIDKPRLLPNDFLHLKIDNNKDIYFWCLVPIYQEELNFKLQKGANALIELFNEAGISQIVDVKRKNVCIR